MTDAEDFSTWDAWMDEVYRLSGDRPTDGYTVDALFDRFHDNQPPAQAAEWLRTLLRQRYRAGLNAYEPGIRFVPEPPRRGLSPYALVAVGAALFILFVALLVFLRDVPLAQS